MHRLLSFESKVGRLLSKVLFRLLALGDVPEPK